MYEPAYMVMSLPVLLFFLATLASTEFRRASFWTAVACVPAGIIGERWLIPDYWDPEYLLPPASFPWRFGLEDIIITGALAGVSAAAFQYCARRQGLAGVPPMSARTFLVMEMFWNPPGTWCVLLSGVPAEGPVWAFLASLYCGVIYRVAASNRPFSSGSPGKNDTAN